MASGLSGQWSQLRAATSLQLPAISSSRNSAAAGHRPAAQYNTRAGQRLELQTKVREDFTITEMAPTSTVGFEKIFVLKKGSLRALIERQKVVAKKNWT